MALGTMKKRVSATEYNNVELYEIITKSDDFGIVTKHLIFEDEPQFTFLGVEYVEKDDVGRGDPVFL